MSLTIEIDSNTTHHIPFQVMRERLQILGQRFTVESLSRLPYNELHLAAIANAGQTACTMDQVIAEKAFRRSRFFPISDTEMDTCVAYLKFEGMYQDVYDVNHVTESPAWDDLSPLVKLWCVANCLHNHCDAPALRLNRATALVEEAAWKGSITAGQALSLLQELDRLRWSYPYLDSPESFAYLVGSLAEEIMCYMTSDELAICQADQVRDYSCTSDCYHPVTTC